MRGWRARAPTMSVCDCYKWLCVRASVFVVTLVRIHTQTPTSTHERISVKIILGMAYGFATASWYDARRTTTAHDAWGCVIIIHMNRLNCMRTPLDNAHAHAQARRVHYMLAFASYAGTACVRASMLRKCVRCTRSFS